MHGLHCKCNHTNKPYISAYDIALKHGFKGSEEDWVNTLQSVYVAKVTGNNLASWECSDTYAELVEKSAYAELHLLTLEGRTAFCMEISDSQIVFQSLPYVSGNDKFFDEYILTNSDVGHYLQGDAYIPGQGAIERNMLSGDVQTSLGKADTSLQNIDDAVPRNKQAAKTAIDARKVAIGSDGTLYYETPSIIYVPVIYDNGEYVIDESSSLRGYDGIMEAVQAGADVRLLHVVSSTFEIYPLINSPDPHILVFAGPHYNGVSTYSIVYFVWDEIQGITRVVKTLS